MTSVQPTNNPVPSDHPADARDNFKRIDEVVNSQSTKTSPTRTGKTLDTLAGLASKYIASPVNGGVWAAGVEFTAYNQYMAFGGVSYKPSFSTPLPYTTQGSDPTVLPDSNFVEPFSEINSTNISTYTDIAYKASGGNTAFENLVAGIPTSAESGDFVSLDGVRFKVNSAPVSSIGDLSIVENQDQNRGPKNQGVVDVFLIYGQSNARGTASITEGAPSYISDRAKMYNGTSIVDLEVNMQTQNNGTSSGSAWAAFANEYIARTGRRCVFANCANGSQSIQDLQKGEANTNFSGLVSWHNSIISLISSSGDSVGNVSILFNQGERDQAISTTYESYIASINQLWSDIKSDTSSTMIFLWELGLSLSSSIRGAWPVQSAQKYFCNDNSDAFLVYSGLGGFNSSNGLSDNTHYTQVGYNKMGREGAISVAGIVFDEGAEGSDIPESNGSIQLSTFQSWQYATACFTKSASGWTFNNGEGRSGSFIFELNDTTDLNELRLKVSTPLNQYIHYSATAEQSSAVRGLTPCARVESNSDQISNSFIGVKFVMSSIELRANLSNQTIDVASLGSSFSSIINSIVPTWGTGSLDLQTPRQNGLPSGAIRGSTGKHLRVNSSGYSTTSVRLTDINDAPVNDEVNVILSNVEIPLSDVPIGTEFSVGVIFSTFRT